MLRLAAAGFTVALLEIRQGLGRHEFDKAPGHQPVAAFGKILVQRDTIDFFLTSQADTGHYGDPQPHFHIFFDDFPAARFHLHRVVHAVLLKDHIDNIAGSGHAR